MVYLRVLLKNTPDVAVAGSEAAECVVQSSVRQLNKLISVAVAVAMH